MLAARPFTDLRHGETDWNHERRIQGCTDVALNARGIAQAEAAREALRGVAIATICASPPKELDRIGVTEFREAHFEPYRIIYRIEERKVVVHCVADGRRDMQSLLRRRLLR